MLGESEAGLVQALCGLLVKRRSLEENIWLSVTKFGDLMGDEVVGKVQESIQVRVDEDGLFE